MQTPSTLHSLRAFCAALILTLLAACGGGDGVPAIVTQPQSTSVAAGQTATFTVSADGTLPLVYQWSRNGVAIPGANAASYTTPAAALAGTGALYSVRVSNLAGSTVSNPATLTVGPLAVTPTITLQPAAITVTAGQPADFRVMATGTTPLSYQWRRDGADIPGATAPTYSMLRTLIADDGAMLTVAVRNTAGDVVSAPARLGVVAAAVAPSIDVQPANISVNTGQVAVFKVAASGTGLSYQWRRNGVVIVGATGPTFLTRPALPTTLGDSGRQFSVVVSNSVGSVTSRNAALTVTTARVAPNILVQPASVSAVQGQQASFSVAANGSTPLTYQWRRNGVNIPGATTGAYTTPPVLATDNGAQFSVSISNTAGSVVSTAATLTVAGAAVAPSIVTQPVASTVVEGQPASFSVAATGTEPFTYQWLRNGSPIANSNSPAYSIAATTLADSGAVFSVVVSNAASSVTSAGAQLTVTPLIIAPSITTQPSNAAVNTGEPATFSVAAAGTAPLSYQWRRDGIAIIGATLDTYTTPPAVLADNGARFSVVVSNASGVLATSNDAVLTVTQAPIAPTITTQPANVAVLAGQPASFSVVATGTPLLTYQWLRGGFSIVGATSATYTLGQTALNDDGALFSVVVTNAAGSTTSATATLSVANQNGAGTVSAGYQHSCAVTAAGGLKCWGGMPTIPIYGHIPVDVAGLTSGVAAVSAGLAASHSCILMTTGEVRCWGDNGNSQLGELGAGLLVSATPLTITGLGGPAVAVSTGGVHNCVLTAAGGVKCWGGNGVGQLGIDGTPGLPLVSPVPTDVKGLTSGVVAISAGEHHTCALMATGGIKCWGLNSRGQLGIDVATATSTVPVDVPAFITGAAAVSAGGGFTCVVTTQGGIKCWGEGSTGELGNGIAFTGFFSATPVDVSGLTTGVTAISAGLLGACAMTTSSTTWCWGNNVFGQLGNGSSVVLSALPVAVVGLPSLPNNLAESVTAISSGYFHKCARTSAGRIACWGGPGWLGDGGTDISALPVSVVGFP